MRRLFLLSVILPLLAACANVQRASPDLHISSDLRTVAFFAPTAFPGDAPRAVTTLDRASGAMSTKTLPDFRTGDKLYYLGNRLYVASIDRPNAAGFVLDDGTWTKVPYVDTVWYPPFVARYNGQPAVFGSQYTTEVHALHDFSLLATLDLRVRGVGDGYMLRYQWAEGVPALLTSFGWLSKTSANPDGATTWKTPVLAGMDLLDADQNVIMHLDHPPAAQRPFTDGEAQISPDHRLLMIAPWRHGPAAGAWGQDSILSWYYTGFAVYEVPSGKLLYARDPYWSGPRAGAADAAEIHGTPVTPVTLANDGVYAIEETIPPDPAASNPALPHRVPNRSDHQFWLTRYCAEGRRPLMQLPLSAKSINTFSTAASAAGGFMVIHTLDPAPHLIEVPLRPDVTEKDLGIYNLTTIP